MTEFTWAAWGNGKETANGGDTNEIAIFRHCTGEENENFTVTVFRYRMPEGMYRAGYGLHLRKNQDLVERVVDRLNRAFPWESTEDVMNELLNSFEHYIFEVLIPMWEDHYEVYGKPETVK